MDCTEGTYNPLEGSDLGTACLNCPEFSTSPISSSSINDCVCQEGFIQTILPDGSAVCECDAGKEIMNGVRCDACGAGMYKPASGNSKCFECALSPLPLAAKEFTTTKQTGSKLASDCVCKVVHMHLTQMQHHATLHSLSPPSSSLSPRLPPPPSLSPPSSRRATTLWPTKRRALRAAYRAAAHGTKVERAPTAPRRVSPFRRFQFSLASIGTASRHR